MKKMIQLIALGATIALIALPVVVAKNLIPASEVGQDQCTPENKDAYYAAFRENRPNDTAKAYEQAKKYLACPATEPVTEAQQKIIDYLKKWSATYEKESRKVRFNQLIYVDKKYPEAYALGKEILTDEPENLKILMDLGANGYLVAAAKNPALNTDAVNFAKKAIQLLESGKTVEAWQPFSGKDEALAYLNYTLGYMALEQDPTGALGHLIKAAGFEGPLKKSPYTYAYIGGAYESGPYAKQSDEYKKLYEKKDETPESKLALANINQVVDRMIDAYARAVNVAGADAKFQAKKVEWTESLSTWYKYRHNQTDTGMNELVAGIMSKPLPPEPTPLTSLPASVPGATPGATPAATPTATPAATPAATPTATPAATPTSSAAPGATPAGANKTPVKPTAPVPTKPKPRLK